MLISILDRSILTKLFFSILEHLQQFFPSNGTNECQFFNQGIIRSFKAHMCIVQLNHLMYEYEMCQATEHKLQS